MRDATVLAGLRLLKQHPLSIFCMPACKLFLPFTLLLLPLAIRAQQPATLPITDATTGSPLPYASVGIQHKPIGAVADGEGRFVIQPLSAAAPTDTVVVSCIGYVPRKLLASELSRLAEVKLMPQAQALGEVKVRAAGWKRHRIGHEGSFSFTHYNFYMHTDADANPAARLGCEAGTVLRVPAGSFLEDAHVYIGWSHFRNVRFRLHVRALDKEGQPAASCSPATYNFPFLTKPAAGSTST